MNTLLKIMTIGAAAFAMAVGEGLGREFMEDLRRKRGKDKPTARVTETTIVEYDKKVP